MTGLRRPEDEILDRLAGIRDAEVPDPGADYWQAFPGRVRARVAGRPGRRPAAWRTLAALAAAAAAVAVVWVGSQRLSGGSRPAAGSGTTAAAGAPAGAGPAGWDAESVDGALDMVLGPGTTGYAAGDDLAGLSDDQKRALLESLRAELAAADGSDA